MTRPLRSLLRSLAPVAVLAAVLLVALPSAGMAAEPIFQFTGRGNGHGIGMSQWGAKGLADHGYTYASILSNYYRHAKVLTVPTKTITVYAEKSNDAESSWSMRSVAGDLVLVYVQNGLAVSKPVPSSGGKVYTFSCNGDGWVRMYLGTTYVGRYPGALTVKETPAAGQRAMMVVTSPSGPWDWANVVYRGSQQIVPVSNRVRLYNLVGLEDYVTGVVPRESPASWPAEQLKAQAVAARSYVMASPSAIVYCTTKSQVYNGFGRWDGGKVVRHGSDGLVDAPVAATAGQVLVDADDTASKYTIVQCYFFDTSGGRTEAVQNVWTGSSADQHLVSCEDPYEVEAGSVYHRWYERRDTAGNVIFNGSPAYSATVLRSKLVAAGVPVPGKITDVVVTKRGSSDRVMEIVIKGAEGDNKTLYGSTPIANFRRAFGWGDTWFYVTKFSWDAASISVPQGGSVVARFHVSPAITGDVKGLIKDGVNTGKVMHFVNGVGTVTLTAPGKYWVDSNAYNALDSHSHPDPTKGDLRGTQFYFRNLSYPLVVSAGSGGSQPTTLTLSAVGLSGKVDLRWAKPAGAVAVRVLASTSGHATSPDALAQRVVYEGAAVSATDSGLTNGTVYFYTAFARDDAGTWSVPATASVTPAPLTTPTKLTIAAAPTSVKLPSPFVLSGTLKPGVTGDLIAVEVQKPGSYRWSYSSARLTYNTSSWWYRYTPKVRGIYRFRARFGGGGGRIGSVTGILSVTVR